MELLWIKKMALKMLLSSVSLGVALLAKKNPFVLKGRPTAAYISSWLLKCL